MGYSTLEDEFLIQECHQENKAETPADVEELATSGRTTAATLCKMVASSPSVGDV